MDKVIIKDKVVIISNLEVNNNLVETNLGFKKAIVIADLEWNVISKDVVINILLVIHLVEVQAEVLESKVKVKKVKISVKMLYRFMKVNAKEIVKIVITWS